VPDHPAVSIILPVRNEAKYVRECLDTVLNQDYPKILEVLISDGLSDDGTSEIILEYRSRDPRVSLLLNRKQIQTAAVNDCVGIARGEVIVRMDAHARYSGDYVSKCIQHLLKTGAGNVGGPVRLIKKEAFMPSLINIVCESPFGLGGARFRKVRYEGYVDTVWPGVFWKSVFDKVGLFKEEFVRTEDVEFNRRLRDKGYKIYLTPEIKLYYHARDTLSGLLSQNFQNGYGVIQTLLVAKKITALRHFIPFVFVMSLVFLGVLSAYSGVARTLLGLDLLSYLLTNIFFSVKESFRAGFRYLPVLPIVFLLLHLSYGAGSIWAMVKR
jgi:glycosyltransferase involved in cell wall biosynthesis